jgi:predicted transcriptional regulator
LSNVALNFLAAGLAVKEDLEEAVDLEVLEEAEDLEEVLAVKEDSEVVSEASALDYLAVKENCF